MSTQDCIFCKIATGQIPSQKVLESDAALAFLDITPLAEGHTLLIPKRHAARMEDMEDDEIAEVARVLPRLTRAVLKATGAPGLNILQNNGREASQVVHHVHIHLIPRQAGDGLGFRWNATQYAAGRIDATR